MYKKQKMTVRFYKLCFSRMTDWQTLFNTYLQVVTEPKDLYDDSIQTLEDLTVLSILMHTNSISVLELSEGFLCLDMWRLSTPHVRSFLSDRRAFFENIRIVEKV